MYMVKVDIATCFDSIKQDKLLEILEQILIEVCLTKLLLCFISDLDAERVFDNTLRLNKKKS